MSRGLGCVQRAVLDYLATNPAGLLEGGAPREVPLSRVTMAVFGSDDDVKLASARRAVRTLAAAGLVEIHGRFADRLNGRKYEQRRYSREDGGHWWEVTIRETYVSRPWTEAERAAVEEGAARWAEAMRSFPALRAGATNAYRAGGAP